MLVNDDLAKHVGSRISDSVQRLMQGFGPDVCIAGGFVRDVLRGDQPQDMNIFPVSAGVQISLADALRTHSEYTLHKLQAHGGPNALWAEPTMDGGELYWLGINCNPEFFRPAGELIPLFDLSICQAAVYWLGGWKLEATEEFLAVVQQGQLVPTEHAGKHTLGRVVRFLNRGGYNITAHALADALAPLQGRNLNRAELVELLRVGD